MGFWDDLGNDFTKGVNAIGNYAGKATGASQFQTDPSQFQMPGFQQQQAMANNYTQQAMGGDPNQLQFRGQQSQLANMLFNQANGGGPNLANAQLKDATNRNISQAFAMAQANPNDPNAARLAANNVAGANQTAAGQSAEERMQQQLAAQQQLAGVLQGARGQDLSNYSAMNQAGLGWAGLGQQGANSQLQAQIAQQQIASGAYANSQGAAQSMFGGLVGGIAAGAMSDGGVVPGYASGGIPGGAGLAYFGMGPAQVNHYDPVKFGGKKSKSPTSGPQDPFTGTTADNQAVTVGTPDMLGVNSAGPAASFAALPVPPMASGGQVPEYRQGFTHGVLAMLGGGHVPGKAAVEGDSKENDTVPAMLSPGEGVVPRSKMKNEKLAKAFVAQLVKEHKKTG